MFYNVSFVNILAYLMNPLRARTSACESCIKEP
jgi:hypothetical protein